MPAVLHCIEMYLELIEKTYKNHLHHISFLVKLN